MIESRLSWVVLWSSCLLLGSCSSNVKEQQTPSPPLTVPPVAAAASVPAESPEVEQKMLAAAEALRASAEKELESGDLSKAAELLEKFLAHPRTFDNHTASVWLRDIRFVTSEMYAKSVLAALDDRELEYFSQSGQPERCPVSVKEVLKKIDHPRLKLAYEDGLRRLYRWESLRRAEYSAEKEREERSQIANLTPAQKKESDFRMILNQLRNSSASTRLFIAHQDQKTKAFTDMDITPKCAASFLRALGHGIAKDYVPLKPYSENPRMRLDYLQKKQEKMLEIGELYLRGRWPPSYRGAEDRRDQMVMAFWVTELAVVGSNLPDFRFDEWNPGDQQSVIEVLRLLGETFIFENLPYEISGWDALRRLGK